MSNKCFLSMPLHHPRQGTGYWMKSTDIVFVDWSSFYCHYFSLLKCFYSHNLLKMVNFSSLASTQVQREDIFSSQMSMFLGHLLVATMFIYFFHWNREELNLHLFLLGDLEYHFPFDAHVEIVQGCIPSSSFEFPYNHRKLRLPSTA